MWGNLGHLTLKKKWGVSPPLRFRKILCCSAFKVKTLDVQNLEKKIQKNVIYYGKKLKVFKNRPKLPHPTLHFNDRVGLKMTKTWSKLDEKWQNLKKRGYCKNKK